MKNHLLPILLFITLFSCSHTNESRKISSSESLDLSGSYLGQTSYKSGGKNVKPAVRVYFHPSKEDPSQYYAVYIEYVNLLGMAPQYLAARTVPTINKLIGYLKHITRKVSVFKVTPRNIPGEYLMIPLTTDGESLIEKDSMSANVLKLSSDGNLTHPLEGAKIIKTEGSKLPTIIFPKKDDKKSIQLKIATAIYKRGDLDSTWRKDFLKGNYLAAYGRTDDDVLKLSTEGNSEFGEFYLNPKKLNVSKKKRMKQFTNSKSAFIQGKFKVNEIADGIFLFNNTDGESSDIQHIEKRFGLFIDIFDAARSLNQDVVELVFVNPEDPSDFLMYYEHPQNGEGEGNRE